MPSWQPGLEDTGVTLSPPGGLQILEDVVSSGYTQPSPELGLTSYGNASGGLCLKPLLGSWGAQIIPVS